MNQALPSSRESYLSAADAWRSAVGRRGWTVGTTPVMIDGLAVDPFDLCRSTANDRNAALLCELAIGSSHPRWSATARRETTEAARASRPSVRRSALPSRRDGTRQSVSTPRRGDTVLFVPLADPQVTVLAPIASALGHAGRATTAARVRRAESVPARAGGWRELWFERDREITNARAVIYVARLLRAVRSTLRSAPDGEPVDGGEARFTDHAVVHHRLARHTLATLTIALPELVRWTTSVRQLLVDTGPVAVVVADAHSLQGRATLAVASQLGIPTVLVDDGRLPSNPTVWRDCRADLVCVWSDTTRQMLRSAGVPDRRIAVTGAPHLRPIPTAGTTRYPGTSAATAAARLEQLLDNARLPSSPSPSVVGGKESPFDASASLS